MEEKSARRNHSSEKTSQNSIKLPGLSLIFKRATAKSLFGPIAPRGQALLGPGPEIRSSLGVPPDLPAEPSWEPAALSSPSQGCMLVIVGEVEAPYRPGGDAVSHTPFPTGLATAVWLPASRGPTYPHTALTPVTVSGHRCHAEVLRLASNRQS